MRPDHYDAEYAQSVDTWARSMAWRQEVIEVVSRAEISLDNIIEGPAILDVGCNTGRMVQMLSLEYGYNCYGVDVNEDAIAMAKEGDVFADIRHYDGMFLPNYDVKFDAIFFHHALAHALDPAILLWSASTKLRKGGKVVIVTPNPVYQALMYPYNKLSGYQGDPTILHKFSANYLIRVLHCVGFQNMKVSYVGEHVKGLGWTKAERLRSRLVVIGELA